MKYVALKVLKSLEQCYSMATNQSGRNEKLTIKLNL